MKNLLVNRSLYVGLLIVVILPLAFAVSASTQGPRVAQREVDGDNVREVLARSGADDVEPSISLIDSPTPYCFQPHPARNECFINWASMHVEGAPASMRAMTVTLTTVGPVARYQGFFQDTMDITYAMHGRGFQVPCGQPGAGGQDGLGNGYDWTIRAEDTDGATSSNSGTLYCPPYAE
jgi:hypothetical protein